MIGYYRFRELASRPEFHVTPIKVFVEPRGQLDLRLRFSEEERSRIKRAEEVRQRKRTSAYVRSQMARRYHKGVWASPKPFPKERAKSKVDIAMSTKRPEPTYPRGCVYYDSRGRDIAADLVTETSTHYIIEYWEFGNGLVYREVPKANKGATRPYVVVPNGIITMSLRGDNAIK